MENFNMPNHILVRTGTKRKNTNNGANRSRSTRLDGKHSHVREKAVGNPVPGNGGKKKK